MPTGPPPPNCSAPWAGRATVPRCTPPGCTAGPRPAAAHPGPRPRPGRGRRPRRPPRDPRAAWTAPAGHSSFQLLDRRPPPHQTPPVPRPSRPRRTRGRRGQPLLARSARRAGSRASARRGPRTRGTQRRCRRRAGRRRPPGRPAHRRCRCRRARQRPGRASPWAGAAQLPTLQTQGQMTQPRKGRPGSCIRRGRRPGRLRRRLRGSAALWACQVAGATGRCPARSALPLPGPGRWRARPRRITRRQGPPPRGPTVAGTAARQAAPRTLVGSRSTVLPLLLQNRRWPGWCHWGSPAQSQTSGCGVPRTPHQAAAGPDHRLH
mmetsp:Transcript_146766/g.408857  ORF Transcript_146766/g.408857 Transcript_146766/m.408857 type:complete len:321 (+) Transcript_146766:90-1052(+)